MKKLIAVVFGCIILGAVGLAPAWGSHSVPSVSAGDSAACGEITIDSQRNDTTHPLPANARLVVSAEGETENVPVGDSITVGPFSGDDTVTVYYRIFGGGERDYDVPLWNGYGTVSFVADITAYGASNGFAWVVSGPDDDNPFTTWETVDVDPCPAPSSTARTCEAPGFITIPEHEGVTYEIDGDPHEAGTFAFPPGSYEVTAGGLSWSIVVQAELEACPGLPGDQGPKGDTGDQGPAGEDGLDGRDGKDGQDGRDGADGKNALPSPVAVPTAVDGGLTELPRTGLHPGALAAAAAGLTALGLGSIAANLRGRRQQ